MYKRLMNGLNRRINAFLKHKFAYIETVRPYNIITHNEYKALAKDVAVIIGGSGAIGRSIACRLAAEGAKVYVCGTSLESAQKTVNSVEKFGGNAHALNIDLCSEESICQTVKQIIAVEEKIDILVNCAGGSSRSLNANIDSLPTQVIDSILSVNLRGTILCCREIARYMVQQKRGKIVCITSIIGERGKARFSEYAAAKAGIIAFVKSIAMELGPKGINVNCVSPGIVSRGQINGEQIEAIKKTNYLNDFGTPEDIANMTLFLVSNEARFITGQNFIVDGGRSLGLKGD